jgi:hypothetical protein
MRKLQAFAVAIALIACGFDAFAQVCPSAPQVTTPANGATAVPRFVSLRWTDVGASSYDVFLGPAGAGCNSNSPIGTATTNGFNPPELAAGTTYEWKIRAIRAACPVVESTCATFTTASSTCPTGAPTLTSPANNAQLPAGNVTLSWTAVTGATSYELWFSTNNGQPFRAGVTTATTDTKPFTGAANFTWYVVANFGAGCPTTESARGSFTITSSCPSGRATLTSPAADAQFTQGSPVTLQWSAVPNATGYEILLSADGQVVSVVGSTANTSFTVNGLTARGYVWAIRALFAAPCPSTVSNTLAFRVVATPTCETAGPALRSPADHATVDAGSVTFEWHPVAGAIGYRLFLLGANTTTPALAYSGTDTRATVANLAGGGSLTWIVQATFADNCPSTESSRRTLTVRAASNCPAAPVTLTSPANGTTGVTNPVTFRWNAVANARSYLVLGALENGSFEVFGTTSETSLQSVVPAGLVKWLVIARADGCNDVRSTAFEFTAVRPTCADASITLRSPANNANVTSPVKFEWTAVSDATAYRVYVSIGGSSMEIVARTTAPEATVSLPAGAGVWKVEALRGNCPPVVSAEGRFNVGTGANCASNTAPVLVSPIGTEAAPANVTSPVTLRWSAVPNAIGYRVWLSRNGQAPSDIALTRNTEITRLMEEEGIYYFFVDAVFEGCTARSSGRSYFRLTVDRCNNAAPVIMTPPNGSTATAPVTFTWGAVERAKSYRVIASLNGGQTFVVGETTDTTLTRVLPPGTVAYAIEAVFDQCRSTFSERVTFTIPESQNCPTTPPQLTSPANGSTNVVPPVTFRWSSVPNAIRYVVIARYNDGAPIPVGETAQTELTVRTLPAGRFEWRVLAFLAGCRPLESATFTFTIDAPENCNPNLRPTVFEPSTGSILLATQVDFDWSDVPNATGYRLWAATGDGTPSLLGESTVSRATLDVPVGGVRFYVEARFGTSCPSTFSAPSFFIATSQAPACRTPATPRANIVGQALSGIDYTLRWTPLPNVELFEVQESASADFSNATTQTVDGISATFRHTVDFPAKFFYRVRGISNCSDERGEFSNVVTTIVASPRSTGTSRNASTEVGTLGTIVQMHFVPGAGPGATFRATVDKPWLTVQPSTGALPLEGITLNVVADPRVLAFGTNTATVSVDITTPTVDGIASDGTTTSKIPFSISLVTPVTPGGKSSPPPDSLIIPAVAHAVGANDSQFESDIRVTNLGATTAKYQVNFTPSGVDGTTSGTSSTIEIAPNETTALDDVLETMFGTGATSVVGMLEIRPLSSSTSSTSFVTTSSGAAPLTTVASSRTYNVTPTGTFGQYIPAIPFSQFAGKGSILSLQQIAQSDVYRTNFGFAEASGEAAELVMRVYDTRSSLIATIPVSLKASEHKQINAMLAANGITNLTDGRVEVEVTSSTGKVTAYASGVDNTTNDPLLVSPVVVSNVSANRFVVPGVALLNTGIANWRTDMRIFNGGTSATAATVTFYPQGNPGAPVAKELMLNAGEIAVLDNVLETFFAQANPNPGGSVIVSTASNAPLVATARTYNQTSAGTYGQFVPGVTPAQAVGSSERSLQVLQLEHSTRIRTNVGIAETTGQPARVEVSLILPDSKVTPVIAYDLAANEFRQLSLGDFGLGNALYNVRATVRVVSGNGRVTAYGSAIDQVTQDPTYVPGI